MKKLFVLLFFACCLSASAQHNNAVYISLQPVDWGAGIHVDHQFRYFGVYASAVRGHTRLEHININQFLNLTVGYMAPISSDEHGYIYHFLVGASYHYYRDMTPDVDKSYLFPVSVEIGISQNIKRFVTALRVDLVKRTVDMDFGFTFKL